MNIEQNCGYLVTARIVALLINSGTGAPPRTEKFREDNLTPRRFAMITPKVPEKKYCVLSRNTNKPNRKKCILALQIALSLQTKTNTKCFKRKIGMYLYRLYIYTVHPSAHSRAGPAHSSFTCDGFNELRTTKKSRAQWFHGNEMLSATASVA